VVGGHLTKQAQHLSFISAVTLIARGDEFDQVSSGVADLCRIAI
jgi:hypothetical protein